MKIDSSLSSPALRITLIRKALSISFLAGIALSIPLWAGDRFFPVAPALDFMQGQGIDIFFFLILVVTLTLLFFSVHRVLMLLFVLSITVLLLHDQMRWQPWVYLYTLMFICLLIVPDTANANKAQLNTLQIIIAGVYFWSGVHKFNPGFIDHTWRDILTKLLGIQIPESAMNSGYIIPLLEASIGLGLLVPRFRQVSVYVALFSHIFILTYLSPLGINANSVVYPWNLAMIAFVILLFWKERSSITFKFSQFQWTLKQSTFILLVWMLPLLNFFGLWDHLLSFSLYSARAGVYYIAVEEKEVPKIDKRLAPYFVDLPGVSGGKLIDVDKWAMEELNVPFYPERRVFRSVAKTFCERGIEEGKIIFLELKHPLRNGQHSHFSCQDL